MRRALVFGISGQDGALLARLLLAKGYEVFGASRDAETQSFTNLATLAIRDRIRTVSVSLLDFRSVLQAIARVQPTEIYNLAGQSSVGLSFEQPVETFDSISVASLNLLEAVRFHDSRIRLYNACSSECFGNTQEPANEGTPMRPRSPYAVAKAAAFWQVANYREGYGLYAVSGILFNHESPLRPARFVTQKSALAARRIAAGSKEKLALGNLDVIRDWGWAPEYVEGMWHMLQQENPDDFVLATGHSFTLRELIAEIFANAGLDWRNHVFHDPTLNRPTDLLQSRADPAHALAQLGWRASSAMPEVARRLVEGVLE
ncbi:MAG: GDP-mannose 4,6-dehydratase [Gammaproteobacteria bacterium]|nr:GDP-mannose 4,6-dehydratase [Gammaproteobacteria bacterium]MBU1645077.1 GDP-mannose 4,6-dehydratase [Gammaproteobacteria bacterium]MBU1973314.1 GDP-mannose 4,6-dehydratase [Gammaproteobacteria bacterium]